MSYEAIAFANKGQAVGVRLVSNDDICRRDSSVWLEEESLTKAPRLISAGTLE